LEHPGKYGGSMLSGFGTEREAHIVGGRLRRRTGEGREKEEE
jgi:hypothetical protein